MIKIRILFLFALSVIATSFSPRPACADSWAPPTKITYKSACGNARLTVTPRDLENQLRYFEDKEASIEPAGQKKAGATRAQARLELLVGKRWQVVWDREIVNDVAPVLAIVRDDGEYAVTFDNWHTVGYGPDVVAIYAKDGALLHKRALSDIIPENYIKALQHSVSSINWRDEPRFSPDGQRVIIPVSIPSDDYLSDPPTVELAIDLTEGTTSPIDPKKWEQALATGRDVLAKLDALQAELDAAFLAPLLGPKINGEQQWHEYLREAVARLIERADEIALTTKVLRSPSAKDYAVSETWLREAFTDGFADHVALASISESNLAAILQKTIPKLPKRSYSKLTVYVAISDQHWPSIVAAIQPTGAKLVQLNPEKPIPQRSERISSRGKQQL